MSPIELIKYGILGFMALLVIWAVLPPLIMFLVTGDVSYWADAFAGLVVPWWVDFSPILIVIVLFGFAWIGWEDWL